jgi:hypothetical protein
MQIQDAVLNYRNFLLSSWLSLSETLRDLNWDTDPYFIDEWMQSNWELLVERQVGDEITLLPYGYDSTPGARYLEKNKSANRRLIADLDVQPLHEKSIFLCFTSKTTSGFETAPPFNFAYLESIKTRERFAVPIEGLSFRLEPL